MSYISFGKFIPKYFILFDAILNGIVLILLSDFSLLIYRNVIDFYIWILDPVTLLDSFFRF